MLIPTPRRILIARDPVDFRKQIDGLAAVCEVHLAEHPLDGTLFVLRNRRGNCVKMLVWTHGGFTEGNLLLVDGGSEFNQVVSEQALERGGCWSHLRTYFFHALQYNPTEAGVALRRIRDLFMIERVLWGKPPDDVVALRREHAAPVVDGLFTWIEAISTTVRPESRLGKAVTYARNQEAHLRLHLDHGEMPMHNNLSELMLRQNVVGRKNWLFARSEGGAQVAATAYTLIQSCMLQGIDPHTYLVDVLGRLQDYPSNRVGELTPLNWRLAREHHATAMG